MGGAAGSGAGVSAAVFGAAFGRGVVGVSTEPGRDFGRAAARGFAGAWASAGAGVSTLGAPEGLEAFEAAAFDAAVPGAAAFAAAGLDAALAGALRGFGAVIGVFFVSTTSVIPAHSKATRRPS